MQFESAIYTVIKIKMYYIYRGTYEHCLWYLSNMPKYAPKTGIKKLSHTSTNRRHKILLSLLSISLHGE